MLNFSQWNINALVAETPQAREDRRKRVRSISVLSSVSCYLISHYSNDNKKPTERAQKARKGPSSRFGRKSSSGSSCYPRTNLCHFTRGFRPPTSPNKHPQTRSRSSKSRSITTPERVTDTKSDACWHRYTSVCVHPGGVTEPSATYNPNIEFGTDSVAPSFYSCGDTKRWSRCYCLQKKLEAREGGFDLWWCCCR